MSFFAQSSGSFVSLKNVGDSFTGIISGPLSERQALEPGNKTPRTTKAGKPVMEVVIPVKDAMTGDDKTWTVSAWRAKQAIGDAIIAASGGTFRDPELGGHLTLTITGKNHDTAIPANEYSASYVTAANAAQAPAPQAAPMQQQYADPNAGQNYGQAQPNYGQPMQQAQYVDPNAQQGYGQPMQQNQMQQAPAQNYGQPMTQNAPGYGQPTNVPAPY